MLKFIDAFKALFLPNSKPAAVEADQGDAPASPETQRPTILIIDDDTTMVEALRSGFMGRGFKVLTANSGVKGLEMVRFTKDEIRVVLLDFSMPRLDGLQTLQHLRKLSPRSKVIGYTGVGLSELPDGFGSGVDVLLAKPCTSGQLITAINQLLEQPTVPVK